MRDPFAEARRSMAEARQSMNEARQSMEEMRRRFKETRRRLRSEPVSVPPRRRLRWLFQCLLGLRHRLRIVRVNEELRARPGGWAEVPVPFERGVHHQCTRCLAEYDWTTLGPRSAIDRLGDLER